MQTRSSACALASRNSAQAAQASWKRGSCSAHQGCTHQGQKCLFAGQLQLQEIASENHFYLFLSRENCWGLGSEQNNRSRSPVPLPQERHCSGSVCSPRGRLDVGTMGMQWMGTGPAEAPLVPDHGAPTAPLPRGRDKEQLLPHHRQSGWPAQVIRRLVLWWG